VDTTALSTARAVGKLEGLDYVLNMKFEETEEEDG